MDSDFRREMLESTKEGSRSCPQKKEVAGVHRRRKLLKSTVSLSSAPKNGGKKRISKSSNILASQYSSSLQLLEV